MATKKRSQAKKNPTATPELPLGFTRTPPQQLREEDIKNLDLPPVYCNNFQIRGGPFDVWLCFNAVNPVGSVSPSGQFIAERKATVVVSLAQFFAITDMMSNQAKLLQEQIGGRSSEG